MNLRSRIICIFSAWIALSFTASAAPAARAIGSAPHFASAITSSQTIVNGEVTERTETGFTVLSRPSELTTVLVTADTTITKGAATIHLSDLMVGDKVSVTLMKSADGKFVAVSVVVRVGNE